MIPKERLEIRNVKFKRYKSKQSEDIAQQSREILQTFVYLGAGGGGGGEFVPVTIQMSNFQKLAFKLGNLTDLRRSFQPC